MAHWRDQLRGGNADRLTPAMFPKRLLIDGMHHELEHTKSHRLAMEIAMDHLAEDLDYYQKLKNVEGNPSTSRRQQRFMCAEYGRKQRGQRTRTGMSIRQLKEFCMARKKNPKEKWKDWNNDRYPSRPRFSLADAAKLWLKKQKAKKKKKKQTTRAKNPKEVAFASATVQEAAGTQHLFAQWARRDEGMRFIAWLRQYHPEGYRRMVIAARRLKTVGPSGRKKTQAIQYGSHLTLEKAGLTHRFKEWARNDEGMYFGEWLKRRYPQDAKKLVKATHVLRREKRAKNPHLTSGKWRFVGMFRKGEIGSVKRILKIHGMKYKVTKDALKGEKGQRELYVERGAFDTAYRAISRLFEAGKAA